MNNRFTSLDTYFWEKKILKKNCYFLAENIHYFKKQPYYVIGYNKIQYYLTPQYIQFLPTSPKELSIMTFLILSWPVFFKTSLSYNSSLLIYNDPLSLFLQLKDTPFLGEKIKINDQLTYEVLDSYFVYYVDDEHSDYYWVDEDLKKNNPLI